MTNKLKAIITVGIPASGKSTFAREIIDQDPSYIEVNRDITRVKEFNVKGWSEYQYSEENEKIVSDRLYETYRDFYKNGRNIIVTDTNLKLKYLKITLSFLEHLGYDVSIRLCKISLLEAVRRNSNRTNPLPTEDIQRQIKTFNDVQYKIKQKYPDKLI